MDQPFLELGNRLRVRKILIAFLNAIKLLRINGTKPSGDVECTWSKADISADGFGELVMARMVRIVSVAGVDGCQLR